MLFGPQFKLLFWVIIPQLKSDHFGASLVQIWLFWGGCGMNRFENHWRRRRTWPGKKTNINQKHPMPLAELLMLFNTNV